MQSAFSEGTFLSVGCLASMASDIVNWKQVIVNKLLVLDKNNWNCIHLHEIIIQISDFIQITHWIMTLFHLTTSNNCLKTEKFPTWNNIFNNRKRLEFEDYHLRKPGKHTDWTIAAKMRKMLMFVQIIPWNRISCRDSITEFVKIQDSWKQELFWSDQLLFQHLQNPGHHLPNELIAFSIVH